MLVLSPSDSVITTHGVLHWMYIHVYSTVGKNHLKALHRKPYRAMMKTLISLQLLVAECVLTCAQKSVKRPA